MAISKGEWKARERPDDYDWSIFSEWDKGKGYAPIGLVFGCLPRSETGANANMIVTAVNACQEVNPDNPMAVAESIKDVYEELKEAKLQIEYLHDKFKVTGTGNTVLARIDNTLAKAERRE